MKKSLLLMILLLFLTTFLTAISYDDVEIWAGEGSNKAVLIVDWQDDQPALMWGYNYTAMLTGREMFDAILEADERLILDGTSFVNNLYFVSDGDTLQVGLHGNPNYWSIHQADITEGEDLSWSHCGGLNSTLIGNNKAIGVSYGIDDPASSNTEITPASWDSDDPIITFDDIEYWIGEGSNQAALVIDWQDELSPVSMLWGYRWNGIKSGQDMLNEIIAADERLSGDGSLPSIIQYDINNNGTIEENDHNANGDMSDGNFWAYYEKNDDNQFYTSNLGHAGHILENGDWSGWSFVADWTAPWPEIREPIAAEIPTPEELSFNELSAWVGEGTNEAMLVIDFNSSDDPQSYAWGYRWDGEADGSTMLAAIAEIDTRLTIDADSFLSEISLDLDLDGTPEYTSVDGGDFWSTWSKSENGNWASNAGITTSLEDNGRFGCSYGFTPAPTEPNNPVAIPEIPIIEPDFTFAEIEFWVGEGENEAAFVIDWADDKNPQSLVWGYRWNGTATGLDMAQAIVEADPRLQADTDAIFQLAKYDINNDGIINADDHSWDEVTLENDYWSYYVKDDVASNWGYSTSGIAGRELSSGSCDGWLFDSDYMIPGPTEITTPVAAEFPINNDVEIDFADVQYWVGNGSNNAVLVIDFNEGTPETFVWGYKWEDDADLTGENLLNIIAEADPRLTIEVNGFLSHISLDLDSDGNIDYSSIGGTDYWSTWSHLGGETPWIFNSGIGEIVSDDHAFGASYGFTPEATAPNNLTFISENIMPEAPIAIEDLRNLRNDMQQMIDILANDTDNSDFNEATINITSSPSHGTITIDENNKVQFLPESNYEGQDSFYYTITDLTDLTSNEVEVTVNIFAPFSANAEDINSIAISMESEDIVGWANSGEITRGYINIADPSEGMVSYGDLEDGLGQAEGTSTEVVSLGDAGSITLSFEYSLKNGEGYDFAIFENSFNHTSLEFAFVEVSSDGETFVRFPAVSLTQTYTQTEEYDTTNPQNIHNLAGKFKQGFGTPFDLAELADSTNVNINEVTHVRLIDVVGSIDPQYASYDSFGAVINDPFPGSSASNGFDLDGVAVMNWNSVSNDANDLPDNKLYAAYPNPFNISSSRSSLNIKFSIKESSRTKIRIYNARGQFVNELMNENLRDGEHIVSWNARNAHNKIVPSGIYFYQIKSGSFSQTKKLMIVK